MESSKAPETGAMFAWTLQRRNLFMLLAMLQCGNRAARGVTTRMQQPVGHKDRSPDCSLAQDAVVAL